MKHLEVSPDKPASEIVRRTLFFLAVAPLVLNPSIIYFAMKFSPELIENFGAKLPYFQKNLDFLSRSPDDVEGLAVAFSVSILIFTSYTASFLILIAAIFFNTVRTEALIFYCVYINSVKKLHKKAPSLWTFFISIAILLYALDGWNSRVIFGALHVHSNATAHRVFLSTIQIFSYGSVAFFVFVLLVGFAVRLKQLPDFEYTEKNNDS